MVYAPGGKTPVAGASWQSNERSADRLIEVRTFELHIQGHFVMWNRTRRDSMVPLAEVVHLISLHWPVRSIDHRQLRLEAASSSFNFLNHCCNNHCRTSLNECTSAGIGKSSILRAMAGLWLTGEATLIAFGVISRGLDASQRNKLLIHRGKCRKVPWCRSGFPTPETLAAILAFKYARSMDSMLNVWSVNCCESKLQQWLEHVSTCHHLHSLRSSSICHERNSYFPVGSLLEALLQWYFLGYDTVWYGYNSWIMDTAGGHLPSTPWWLQWCWEVHGVFNGTCKTRIPWHARCGLQMQATLALKHLCKHINGASIKIRKILTHRSCHSFIFLTQQVFFLFFVHLNSAQPRRAMMGPLLRKWGLQEARDWTATLSAGERQRLAFARLFMMLVTWTNLAHRKMKIYNIF